MCVGKSREEESARPLTVKMIYAGNDAGQQLFTLRAYQ